MSVSAFTCILHLNRSEDPSRLLKMLPAERRAVVEAELQSIVAQSPTETRNMLAELRGRQLQAQRTRLQKHFRRPLEHASTRLIAWLDRPF